MWQPSRLFGYSLLLSMLAVPVARKVAAQVYSPVVVREGAIDTSDLHRMAQGIVRNAHAETPREKAEAIWRYFLTDGRFVRPGIFYHIPGWSYEEPMGEVLDPVKLVNSYGFGLCYQDAPLLEATWEAAGMPARVWFLTGHTVAEVFYDGAYHYYDSDMMGYTTTGTGPVWKSPVASVQQLAADPSILLNKLSGPKTTRAGAVDFPWYPADVRAGAIDGLAKVFSSRDDNYVFAGTRFSGGHTMDFTLRPGERMIRYYAADNGSERYLPYKNTDGTWQEFPKDWSEILQVGHGPLSEKDDRHWSTGVLEYRPDEAAQQASRTSGGPAEWVYRVSSPYVLINAHFQADREDLKAETSIDDGHTWTPASSGTSAITGWTAKPADLAATAHGKHNAIAGTYGYLLRLHANKVTAADAIPNLLIRSTFEANPRTLPDLQPGKNRMEVTASQLQRKELPVGTKSAKSFALSAKYVTYNEQQGQGWLQNEDGHDGELIFAFDRARDGDLREVDAGGRFLDLGMGLAPDKLTAEARPIKPWPASSSAPRSASIEWSTSEAGPWTDLWVFAHQSAWLDKAPVAQVLEWPQVDRKIDDLPSGSARIYVRYRFRNLALDDIRLATMSRSIHLVQALQVTHCWTEDGRPAHATQTISSFPATYTVDVPQGADVRPVSLVLAAASEKNVGGLSCVGPASQ